MVGLVPWVHQLYVLMLHQFGPQVKHGGRSPVAKVELIGQLPKGVTGKDIIVALCGIFNNDEVLNHAIEFVGDDAISKLPIDYRLTIANMTTEWGALSGLFPVDETLVEFYQNRLKKLNKPDHPRINNQTINQLINNKLTLDNDAVYAKHLQIDLSSSPYISVLILSKFLIHYTTCPNKTLPLIKLTWFHAPILDYLTFKLLLI